MPEAISGVDRLVWLSVSTSELVILPGPSPAVLLGTSVLSSAIPVPDLKGTLYSARIQVLWTPSTGLLSTVILRAT